MSSEEFLLCFRRFCARRGTPKSILSDNATQFLLARETIKTQTDLEMEWKTIPAFAPWAGGVYEKLNSLIKAAYRRAIGRKMLKINELETVITEIEGIINSRPITFVSNQPDGLLALRPIDFLIPRVELNLPFPEFDPEDSYYKASSAQKLAERWAKTAEASSKFWEKWSQDYLLMLRQRTQDKHKTPRSYSKEIPKIGHIVLIEEELLPKNVWPMAKIIGLNGPANSPRSAILKLPNGNQITRQLNRLVPLETIPEKESNSPLKIKLRKDSSKGYEIIN